MQEAFSHGNITATDNTIFLWLFGNNDFQVVFHTSHLFPRVPFYPLPNSHGREEDWTAFKKMQKNNARQRNQSPTGISALKIFS